MAASLIVCSKWLAGKSVSPLAAPSAAWSFAFAMLLLPHDDFAVFATRDRALDEQQVLLGIDLDDAEILDGLGVDAHVPRHFLAGEGAGGIGVRADGTGLAHVLRSVGFRSAAELMALDGAREAVALA